MYKEAERNIKTSIISTTRINDDKHKKTHIIVRPKHSSFH